MKWQGKKHVSLASLRKASSKALKGVGERPASGYVPPIQANSRIHSHYQCSASDHGRNGKKVLTQPAKYPKIPSKRGLAMSSFFSFLQQTGFTEFGANKWGNAYKLLLANQQGGHAWGLLSCLPPAISLLLSSLSPASWHYCALSCIWEV